MSLISTPTKLFLPGCIWCETMGGGTIMGAGGRGGSSGRGGRSAGADALEETSLWTELEADRLPLV